MLTLVLPCPLHWHKLCRHSDITTVRCSRITHSITHTQPWLFTILFTLHRHSVPFASRSWFGGHVTVRFRPLGMAQPTHWHRGSFPSSISASRNMFIMALKVYCSFMLQWILNLIELCKSCCYAISVSVLGWPHNGFHECLVTKLSKLLADVLFHGGATLAIYIDCQRALPELCNFIINRF